jgi:tetratricopeptide (TPR) repeat protein
MAKLLIQSMGCPNCGAPYEHETRNCRFCNSVLIVTSLAETFKRSLEAHQVAESLEKWRQRIKEHPENAEAHFALGLSYLNSKLRDAALVHLRKAVLLAPEVADTHHNLAITLLNDGNIEATSPEYSEAVKEIDYSVQLAPDFGESVAFKHIFVARKLEVVDLAQALTEYRKAVEACPNIATLQYHLGLCYRKLKNVKEAETCFQRSVELDPSHHQQFPDGLLPRGVWGSERSEEGLTWTMGPVRLALS